MHLPNGQGLHFLFSRLPVDNPPRCGGRDFVFQTRINKNMSKHLPLEHITKQIEHYKPDEQIPEHITKEVKSIILAGLCAKFTAGGDI